MVNLFEKYLSTNIAELFKFFKSLEIKMVFTGAYNFLGASVLLLTIFSVLAVIPDACPTSRWRILISDARLTALRVIIIQLFLLFCSKLGLLSISIRKLPLGVGGCTFWNPPPYLRSCTSVRCSYDIRVSLFYSVCALDCTEKATSKAELIYFNSNNVQIILFPMKRVITYSF